MNVLFLTNEYPPHVYGGAGVHVDYLSRSLCSFANVEVRCFGDQRSASENLTVRGFPVARDRIQTAPDILRSTIGTIDRCVQFNALPVAADVVHCHTWYSHFGGILAKLLYDAALVITTHSLEPLRPWKKEQIGRGFNYSSWIEKTALEMADAVIAVSRSTKEDILAHFNCDPDRIAIIPNGIDTGEYRKTEEREALDRYGIPRDLEYILFVGRITRQKGIIHLVRSATYLDPDIGIVLCAGAPDTPEIAQEMKEKVAELKKTHPHVYWIEEMLPKNRIVQFYSHASLFCCPSIYEPFGIINLEAMSCGTPVVASKVGGIPEVVVHDETGLLVPLEQESLPPFEARHPEKFARDLAAAMSSLMSDGEKRKAMAEAGRKRVCDHFSWHAIAGKVYELYQHVQGG
ncbi:MAG: glycogen synthase [Spirochaetales bacterium]|nr:glycogen synthase [Spirochaetales bacterium]